MHQGMPHQVNRQQKYDKAAQKQKLEDDPAALRL